MGIKKRNTELYPHIAALIAVTAWGASFISTKILLMNGLTAVQIYIYRFVLAYIFTMIVCPKPLFSRSLHDEILFILCGICGGSVYFIAENMAVTYTLVSNVSLIVTTSPILTTILILALYKTEKVSRWFMVGSIVALIGVGFVIFNSSVNLEVNPLGDLLALLAAVCWAIYCIVLRPLSSTYSSWFITRKTFFYGIITALPFYIMEDSSKTLTILLEKDVYINLLFLGIFASMLAYLFWGEAIKKMGAISAGNYLYFSPIVTLVLSGIVLKEEISFVGVTGCILIIGGVILGEKGGSKRNITRTDKIR